MRKITLTAMMFFACFFVISCSNIEIEQYSTKVLKMPNNRIIIDSSYTYPGELLYSDILRKYNLNSTVTKSLSTEDENFFSKKFITKSTSPIVYEKRSYIYPGALFEGNSISSNEYIPILNIKRNPITVSSTLNHKNLKCTTKTINNICLSQFSEYVKWLVKDGVFNLNENFLFSCKRFTFYDEIKHAFGSNIDTKGLFSSFKQGSVELNDRISTSTGMFIKFYQSAFTVNMDITPLSDQLVVGNTDYEPAYISSVTYGRMGVLVFETNEEYEFVQKSINKEFRNIFSNGSTTLTENEKRFFENTEFKILIIGSDSDYSVQTVKGYEEFLSLIYNSKFSETNYGVPISCTFSYANSHKLAEIEFEQNIFVEPLFVKMREEKIDLGKNSNYDYNNRFDLYLDFYKDREKTIKSRPYHDIVFKIKKDEVDRYFTYEYDPSDGKEKGIPGFSYDNYSKIIQLRNLDFKSSIFVDKGEMYDYQCPSEKSGDKIIEKSHEHWCSFSLKESPFYLKIN